MQTMGGDRSATKSWAFLSTLNNSFPVEKARPTVAHTYVGRRRNTAIQSFIYPVNMNIKIYFILKK